VRQSTDSDSSFQLWVPKGEKIQRKRKSKQQKIILFATSGDDEAPPIDEEEVYDKDGEQRRSLMLPSIISRSRIAKEHHVSRSTNFPDSRTT